MGKRVWLVNLLCLGAATLIAAAFFFPFWSLTLKAVQYEREFPEGLKVHAYLHKLDGELYELNIMNKWIGARFPADVPEHRVFPILFGGLALLCVISVFLNHWKGRVLKLALVLFLALGIAGTGSLQWRLYAFGHLRDPGPPVLIPDFTVPLLGSIKLYNWAVTATLGPGTYAVILAALLVAAALAITPSAHYARTAAGVSQPRG